MLPCTERFQLLWPGCSSFFLGKGTFKCRSMPQLRTMQHLQTLLSSKGGFSVCPASVLYFLQKARLVLLKRFWINDLELVGHKIIQKHYGNTLTKWYTSAHDIKIIFTVFFKQYFYLQFWQILDTGALKFRLKITVLEGRWQISRTLLYFFRHSGASRVFQSQETIIIMENTAYTVLFLNYSSNMR